MKYHTALSRCGYFPRWNADCPTQMFWSTAQDKASFLQTIWAVKPDMSFHEIVVDDGGFRVHDHNSWDDISWQFPMVGIFSEAILIISTLWLFNIAMENGWKWPIYRWFSQLNTSIYKGFSMAMFTRWYILDHISPWLSHHKYYNYMYIYISIIYIRYPYIHHDYPTIIIYIYINHQPAGLPKKAADQPCPSRCRRNRRISEQDLHCPFSLHALMAFR